MRKKVHRAQRTMQREAMMENAFLKKKKGFIYYVYNILPACMPAGQKRAPDLIIDGCEPPCGCWEMNSWPLEEQPVLLTAEPSHQPQIICL